MCQTGDCTLAGSWGADSNNKENWDWNNNNNSSNNSSSQTTCQCMQQRRVRRRHPATIQTPGREEVGEVQLEPLVSSSSPRLAWETPAAFQSASFRAGGSGFFRDQNQNLAQPPLFDSKYGSSPSSSSSSATDYLIWKTIDASKYQRFDVFEESRGWVSGQQQQQSFAPSSKFV